MRRAELRSLEPFVTFAKRGSSQLPSDEELCLEEECKAKLNQEGDELVVFYTYTVKHEPAEKQRAEDTFGASVAYKLVYSFDSPLGPEHHDALQGFAEHNGRFNSWPFLRAYLARVTAEFGLPPLTLPLLKPYAPKRKNVDEAPEQVAAVK